MDERARHALHNRLDDVLGPDVSGTLMEMLPPVGWADVATKHDVATGLDALGDRIDAQLADLRTELRTGLAESRTGLADLRSDFRAELAASQRLLLFGLLTAMFTLAGLVWAGITLTG